jgi:Cdc6-like AAA superfamily ATPase
MKRATTINELADNLDPSMPLGKEDENVYVPIYDEILSKLRDRIIHDKLESRTLFVAGQSGTGKTTALNFLEDEEISKSFTVKVINFRDLVDLSDVDIIDLLLMIGFELVKGNSLENRYYEKLEEIRKVHKGVLKSEETTTGDKKGTAGAEASVGAKGGFLDILKLKAKFFASYRLEQSYRKEARLAFELNKPELLRTINELIEDYNGEAAGGKKLLLIIDDLDKLKDAQQIRSVFIDNRFYLLELKAKKVIAIPVHLTTENEIISLDVDIPSFSLRLKTNPKEELDPEEERKIISKNEGLLKEIVRKRIAENTDLIDDDAIAEAAGCSGGILRQYIQLLNMATVEVRRLKGKKVTKNDIDNACQTMRKTFERPIIVSAKKIRYLKNIMDKHIPEADDPDESISALIGNQIIAYSNGATWYDVNPLIKETVRIYAQKAD